MYQDTEHLGWEFRGQQAIAFHTCLDGTGSYGGSRLCGEIDELVEAAGLDAWRIIDNNFDQLTRRRSERLHIRQQKLPETPATGTYLYESNTQAHCHGFSKFHTSLATPIENGRSTRLTGVSQSRKSRA